MSRSVYLKLEEGWPTRDHAHYVRLLIGAGVKADDIKQIDLHGRAGMCVVTVSCQAVRDSIVSNGLSIDGRPVEMVISGGSVVSLHLFGVEDDLSLAAIVQAVEKFGSVVGGAKREKKSVDGCSFTTGTVYVNVALRAVVPSLIPVGSRNRKYRVWHQGQVQTCWKCNRTGHVAKDCTHARKSSRRPSTDDHATPASQADDVIGQAYVASATFAEAAGRRVVSEKGKIPQPDENHPDSSVILNCEVAVDDNEPGTPSPAPGTSAKQPDDTTGEHPSTEERNLAVDEDSAAQALAVSDLDSTVSPVSTSWADSTKTDDELEPVDNIVTSTPQPVQVKRSRATPPKGKTRKKKRRNRK